MDAIGEQQYKRNIAYKLRIGDILAGKPILDAEKLKFLEIDNKNVSRVNLIANIIDKFVQEGEKKYATLTIDDASGQIRIKAFGEDVDKLTHFNQGDTIVVIGLLRSWNNQVYLTPEIIKKKEPAFLLVRKLELDNEKPKMQNKEQLHALKDKLIGMIKTEDTNGGIDIDKIILELKEAPDIINHEIKKLLEDGIIYEPRPGKLRYLG